MQTGSVDEDDLKSSLCTIPRIACLVVCGRVDVIATFAPTSALVSVDLPVFGRPTKHTKPEWNSVMPVSSPNVNTGRLFPLFPP